MLHLTTDVIHENENQSNCSDIVRFGSREQDNISRDRNHLQVGLDDTLLLASFLQSVRYIPQTCIMSDMLLPLITYMAISGCQSLF